MAGLAAFNKDPPLLFGPQASPPPFASPPGGTDCAHAGSGAGGRGTTVPLPRPTNACPPGLGTRSVNHVGPESLKTQTGACTWKFQLAQSPTLYPPPPQPSPSPRPEVQNTVLRGKIKSHVSHAGPTTPRLQGVGWGRGRSAMFCLVHGPAVDSVGPSPFWSRLIWQVLQASLTLMP